MGTSIVWAATLSGSAGAIIDRVAVTPQGAIYVAGSTSSGLPVTSNPFQASPKTQEPSTFVAKMNPDGNALVYATYLVVLGECCVTGGYVGGLAVDPAGNAFIAGSTYSAAQFPVLNGFGSKPQSALSSYLSLLKPDGDTLVW